MQATHALLLVTMSQASSDLQGLIGNLNGLTQEMDLAYLA
jgi:hypothetical protein